jgi:uncharacterized repeat protein (TIGR02543 family)
MAAVQMPISVYAEDTGSTASPVPTASASAAAEPTAYEKTVALFTALPSADTVTQDNKEVIAAQLSTANDAYEALGEKEQSQFETEHEDLLAAFLALNDAVTGNTVSMLESEATITFDANGGYWDVDVTSKEAVASGGTVEIPSDPTCQDATFKGWYTDKTYTTAFVNSNITSNATVYAKWTVDKNGKPITVLTDPLDLSSNPASIDQSSTYGYQWDQGTKTLTLSGLILEPAKTVTGTAAATSTYGISLPADAKIIAAKNTTSSINSADLTFDSDDTSIEDDGISSAVFCPSGTLDISGEGTLFLYGGSVTDSAADGRFASLSMGIYASDITFRDAKMQIFGGEASSAYDAESQAISTYAQAENDDFGSLTMTSGEILLSADGNTEIAYAMETAGLNISGGSLTAAGKSMSIFFRDDKSITTNGATIKAYVMKNGSVQTVSAHIGTINIEGEDLTTVLLGASGGSEIATSIQIAFEPAAKIGEKTYMSLDAAIAAAEDGQTISILNDAALGRVEIAHNISIVSEGAYTITQTGPILIDAGKTLSLGGGDAAKTVTFSGGSNTNDFRLIMIRSGGNLVLHDGASLVSNTMSTAAALGAAVRVAPKAVFTMDGGSIENCTAVKGGAVYVDGPAAAGSTAGTFNMSGGTISSCKANGADAAGGAVYNAGTMNLSAGSIISCSAAGKGGGIYVYPESGKLNMSGGEISKCAAEEAADQAITNDGQGGAVYAGSDTEISLTAGTIKECTASANGAGVHLHPSASMKIGSGVLISNGIYLSDASKPLQIAGALKDSLTIVPAVNEDGTILAEGTDGYTVSAADAAKIKLSGVTKRIATLTDQKKVRITDTDTIKLTAVFKTNGGSAVSSLTNIAYDTAFTAPSSPTRQGYYFIGWFCDEETTKAYNFSDRITENIVLYAGWSKAVPVSSITGTVSENNVPAAGARVELHKGSEIIASATADQNGAYTFTNIPAGEYNLTVISGAKTKTELIKITAQTSTMPTVILPHKAVSSKVEVKGNTPNILVGGLDTAAESQTPSGTDAIEIRFEAEAKTAQTVDGDAKAKIILKAGNQTLDFLDMTVLKLTNGSDPVKISDTGTVLEFVIPYPTEGRDNITLYRYHGTDAEAQAFTALEARPISNFQDGTYYVGNGSVYGYAKLYSTYAIGYTIAKTISFDANGGTVSPASAKTDIADKLASLPIPSKDNCSFDGWYTAAEGGTQVTADTVFAKDTTIYAHWHAVPPTDQKYTITVSAGPGGTITPSSVSVLQGSDKTFIISPEEGYVMDDILIDGISAKGQVTGTSYTFINIQQDHTIKVTFKADDDYTAPDTSVHRIDAAKSSEAVWPLALFVSLIALFSVCYWKHREQA